MKPAGSQFDQRVKPAGSQFDQLVKPAQFDQLVKPAGSQFDQLVKPAGSQFDQLKTAGSQFDQLVKTAGWIQVGQLLEVGLNIGEEKESAESGGEEWGVMSGDREVECLREIGSS